MTISLKQIQHSGPWYVKRGWPLAISWLAMLSLLNASPWTWRWNKAYQPLKWNKPTSTCTESSACSPFPLWVLFCQNTFVVVPLTLKNSPSQSGVLTLPYDGDLLSHEVSAFPWCWELKSNRKAAREVWHEVTDVFKCMSKCMLSFKIIPLQNVCRTIFTPMFWVLLLYNHKCCHGGWPRPLLDLILSRPNFRCCCHWLGVQSVK